MKLLKEGLDVTLDDGRVIKATDVLKPSVKGKKVIILGDTSNPSSLTDISMDCDALVHEATYDASLEEKAIEGGHSTSKMAGRFAKNIRCKKLIINHFSKRYFESFANRSDNESQITVDNLVQEARLECTCEVVAADDFMVVNV